MNKGCYKKGSISWSKLHPELMPRGEKHHLFNKHPSKKTRKKMRIAHLNQRPTEEWKILMSKKFSGKNNPAWKDGRRKNYLGYINVYSPLHPFKDVHNHVKEHRLVMERKLERYLEPFEKIHHLNGIKDDNRIENLLLSNGNKGHQAIHFAMEKFVYKLIRENKVYYNKQTEEFKFNEPI